MSGIPPQLHAEPGTPATEWAAKTTSALSPPTPTATSMNPTTKELFDQKNLRPGTVANPSAPTTASSDPYVNPTTQTILESKGLASAGVESATSTPGHELPGAFPHKQELNPSAGGSITGTASNMVQAVTESVSSTAAAYLPAAAQYLPKSVVDTVSSYIPQAQQPEGTGAVPGAAVLAKDRVVGATTGNYRASEHDRYHKKSLPSTELSGAGEHEHVDGVGALPGRVDESDVTELPEQKAQEDPYLTSAFLEDQPKMTSGPSQGAQAGLAAGALGAATGAAYAVKDTVQNIAQEAKQRILGASDFTSGTVTPGGHVQASVHDRPHVKSLPSSERYGAGEREHVGGVGALPGRFDEPDVTELPEQKEKEDLYLTSAGMVTGSTTIAPGPVIGRAGPKSSLPSQEEEGQKPFVHQAGVGSLPGNVTESGVALLPEERAHPVGKWEHDDKGVQRTRGAEDAVLADAAVKAGTAKHTQLGLKEDKSKEGGATDAATGVAGAAVAAKEKVDSAKETAKETVKGATTGGSHGKPTKAGYDTDYHPALLHPMDADYSKEHADQEKESAGEKGSERPLTSATHTDTTEGSGTAAGDYHDTEKKKKSSFMTKVKGEALVLLGKVEGKRGQDKVAEGERLKSGQSPTTTTSS